MPVVAVERDAGDARSGELAERDRPGRTAVDLSPSALRSMPDYSASTTLSTRATRRQRRPRRRARRRTCSRIWKTTSVGSTNGWQMRPQATTATRACRTSPTRTWPNWTPPPTWRATASQTAQSASPNLRPARTWCGCRARRGTPSTRRARRAGSRARCSARCAASTCEHRPRAPRAGAAVAAPARLHARRRRHLWIRADAAAGHAAARLHSGRPAASGWVCGD